MKNHVAIFTKDNRAGASTTRGEGAPRRGYGLLAAVPGVGAALLLGAACPACWLAYAGLLTTPGLGFLVAQTSLVPVVATAVLLGIALVSFAYRAPARHGYGPLGLGVVAVSLILTGQFGLLSDPLLYAGLAVLVGASLWNAWPRQRAITEACAACAPHASVGEHVSAHKEITP